MSASRRSPITSARPVAQAIERGEEELGLGLADRARRSRRWPPRPPRPPSPSPATARRASGRSRRGSCTTPRPRAAPPAPRRAARRSRSASWPLTTTTSARSARSEWLRIRSPASSTWRWTAAEPITKAVAWPGLGQHVLQRAARGHDLLAGRPGSPGPTACARSRPRRGARRWSRRPAGGPPRAARPRPRPRPAWARRPPRRSRRGPGGRCRRARGQARRARECAHYPRRRALDPARPVRACCCSPAAAATTTTTSTAGLASAPRRVTCKKVARPRAQGRAAPQQAEDDARAGQALRRRPADQLRHDHHPPGHRTRPQDVGLLRRSRQARLLRRAHLPPGRARLRHPGRRPAGHRHRRAGLHGGRAAAAPTSPTPTGVVAMAKTEADPAGASGSQFFIVTAPDAELPPDYARRRRRGPRHGRRAADRQAAGRRRRIARRSPVVIEKATLRTG